VYHVRLKHVFAIVFIQELNMMKEVCTYAILTEGTVVVCTISVYLS